MKHPESDIQRAVVKYLNLKGVFYTASVAGIHTTKLQRCIHKGLGAKKGVPDLMIFEPHNGFKGLFLELKAKNGRSTPEQREWVSELTKRGYKAVICPTFKTDTECFNWAIDIINEYMGI